MLSVQSHIRSLKRKRRGVENVIFNRILAFDQTCNVDFASFLRFDIIFRALVHCSAECFFVCLLKSALGTFHFT